MPADLQQGTTTAMVCRDVLLHRSPVSHIGRKQEQPRVGCGVHTGLTAELETGRPQPAASLPPGRRASPHPRARCPPITESPNVGAAETLVGRSCLHGFFVQIDLRWRAAESSSQDHEVTDTYQQPGQPDGEC